MNVTLSGGPIVHQGKAAAYLAEYVNFFLRFALLSHSHVSVILVSSKFSAETILFVTLTFFPALHCLTQLSLTPVQACWAQPSSQLQGCVQITFFMIGPFVELG